jgi:glycosyltransferase involved in cell wall biosynthesis
VKGDQQFMTHRPTALHLSNTDIRYDGRILRELQEVATIPDIRVEAFGVDNAEGRPLPKHAANISITAASVYEWRWLKFARPLWLALRLCELFARMLPRAICRKPMLVHCHDTLVLPIGLLIKAVTGCRLVYDAHELESSKAGQSRILSLGTLALEHLCWPWIDLLICVSPSIMTWYQRRFGPTEGIIVLNAPLMAEVPSACTINQQYFHNKFGIPRDRKVFLFVGILGKGRAIPLLIEAFKRGFVRAHLVFLGFRDTVGVAESIRDTSNIHLHPPVPQDEVVKFVREADCGLCLIEDASLSYHLCLPNKLFEYAFAGVPILASRLPEIARVVQQYGLGACCDNDADSIEAAVLKIEREGLARPVVDLTELSWNTQAQRLRDAYRNLLDVHPQTR